MSKHFPKNNKGFTLVEIIVAISVFTFVMFISTGSIYSILDSNRKSQSLRAVMDNLNYTLEAMTRSIRFGTNYHCDINQGSTTVPRDCDTGTSATSIAFTGPAGTQIIYKLVNGRVVRNINSGADFYMTGADVTITALSFRVFGSVPYSSGDLFQPQVIIVMRGYAGAKTSSRSSFSLQTTVSQRIFDSN